MRTTHPVTEPMAEYLTVAEAASLLKVHKSTIWRWIDKGQLPVYRVGQRGVRLKKADLERSLTPVSPEKGGTMAQHEQVRARRLTKAEQQRGLRALETLDRLRAELLHERGGTLFPDSAAELRHEREQRTQELMARHTSDLS